MFNRSKAFLCRKLHILDGDIIGEIKPGAAFARHGPERLQGVGGSVGNRRFGDGDFATQRQQGSVGGGNAVCQAPLGGEMACSSASRCEAGNRPCRGHERRNSRVPDRAAIHMAGQVQRRVPSARQTQTIGFNLCRTACMCHRDGPQRQPAGGAGNRCPKVDRAILNRAGVGATVDNGRHLDASGHQITRGAAGVIVIGKDCHTLARRHAVFVQVGANGGRHHDTGAVVVFERDGTF